MIMHADEDISKMKTSVHETVIIKGLSGSELFEFGKSLKFSNRAT